MGAHHARICTRNVPADLVEEAQVAAQLSGIVSEQTQLSVLSCVDSPKVEAERKRGEEAERDDQITWPRGDAWRATGSGEEQGQTPDYGKSERDVAKRAEAYYREELKRLEKEIAAFYAEFPEGHVDAYREAFKKLDAG